MPIRHMVASGLLLVASGIAIDAVASAAVIGMVTDSRGQAHWKNTAGNKPIEALAELPLDAIVEVANGGILSIVYLDSGQEFEVAGPSVVQFRQGEPIALKGVLPRKRGKANGLGENRIRIEPKKVQTAGQTLVSTDAPGLLDSPAVIAAPAPLPATSQPPLSVESLAAAAAARQREVAEAAAAAATARLVDGESIQAQRERAEAAARARQLAEENAAGRDAACHRVNSEAINAEKEEDKKEKTAVSDAESRTLDCPMITF